MKSMNRRKFLGTVGAASAFTIMKHTKSSASNDKIKVGIMGLGGRGRFLTERFVQRPDVEIVWLCDVNQRLFSYGREIVAEYQDKRPELTQDFRDILNDPDVDAIVSATPVHWHALSTIMACQAGKDVYVEKPLTVTPWEGIKMVEAARKYKRVVQVGSQTRSAPYVEHAVNYVQSGKLGDVHEASVYQVVDWKSNIYDAEEEPVPEGLDYEIWCGPAPKLPYRPGHWFRNFWDFNVGAVNGDIFHQTDIARYMLNVTFPKSAYSSGGVYHFKDGREIPDTISTHLEYDKLIYKIEGAVWAANFIKIPTSVRDSDQFPDWEWCSTKIELYGTKGFLRLGRQGGGWQAFNEKGDMVISEPGRQADNIHIANFIDCMRSRKLPNADVEEGRRTDLLLHLSSISARAGNKKLVYDPENNNFSNLPEANKFLRRKDREPWVIPEKV
ncbi:Gfo/Idh/MocA family protein [Bacteroidota bacterium]